MPDVGILDNTFGFEGLTASSPDTFSGANISIPAGNDRVVVVMIGIESGTVPSGITIGGVAATKLITQAEGVADCEIWYRAIGSSGSPTSLAVVATGWTGTCSWGVVALEDVDQSTPTGNTASDSGTTTAGESASLSADAGSAVISAYTVGSDVTISPDSGQTAIGAAIHASMAGAGSYELHASADTATLGHNHTTTNRAVVVLGEFLPAGSETVITPAAAALTLTGSAPLILGPVGPVTITPAAAALTLTGSAPLIFDSPPSILDDPDAAYLYLAIFYPFVIDTEGEVEFPSAIAEYPYLETLAAAIDAQDAAREFMASAPFATEPGDDPANQIFSDRLSQPLTYNATLSEPGAFAPRGSLTAGMEILGGDREVDEFFLGNSLVGRTVQILAGGTQFRGRQTENKLDYDQYDLLFNGRAGGVAWDQNRVTMGLVDISVLLDEPIQTTLYTGAGGLNGDADLAGLPKPIAVGRVFNAAPVLVDAANLIYQFNDGAFSSADAVRDKGVALVFDADYADITAAAPGSGEYATSLAAGFIKLGSPPDGLVTMDGKGDTGGVGYKENIAHLADKIIRQFAGFGDNEIDTAAIAALDTAYPYPGGFYTGTNEIALAEILNQLLVSVDGYWRITRAEKFTVGVFADPEVSAADHTLDYTTLKKGSFRRLATLEPIWRVSLGYQRNYSPQNPDGLAASVSAANRRLYAGEYLREIRTDTPVKNIFKKAREVLIDSLLANQADAAVVAGDIILKYRKRRDVVAWSVINRMWIHSVGSVLDLDLSEFGIDKKMFAFSVSENAGKRTLELVAWG